MAAPPVFRWARTAPNLMPVDVRTGGLAYMVGWTGSPTTSIPGSLTFSAGGSTATPPISVTPGTYTVGVTVTGAATLRVTRSSSDMTSQDFVEVTGSGRLSVSTTVTPGFSTLMTTVYTSSTAFTLSSPTLVLSTADPGPLPPHSDPPSMRHRLYESLPPIYRTEDRTAALPTQTQRPLYQFVAAIGEQADWPLYYADRFIVGELTNPALADDRWIPWLAQAAGIAQSNTTTALADMRAGIAGRLQAAQPGTPAAIVALVRTWLTGMQVCNLVPSSTPWTIAVQVRADEMNGMTSAQLLARIVATGLVPAGFTLSISNALPSWDTVDAANGTTWDAKDKNYAQWQGIDSIGVT